MNKPFLLMAGSIYYPRSGDGNWIKCFETFEEARAQVIDNIKEGDNNNWFRYDKYTINGHSYDWYDIIDLRDWAN